MAWCFMNDSHQISFIMFFENYENNSQNLSSAAVVIGALRVKISSDFLYHTNVKPDHWRYLFKSKKIF